MVEALVEKEILLGAGKLGEVTVKVAVNPLELTSQLCSLYGALIQAAEEADLCNKVCRAMAATACDRAPILCKLLAVGHLFPDDHQDLNEALQGCLGRTLKALQDAVDMMYDYLQHGWVGRMRRAGDMKNELELTRQFLNERFGALDAYVGLATYLQVRQGLQTVVPVVEAVEGLRRDLQALQHITAGDSDHVRAVAAAAVQRRSQKGQKINVEDAYSALWLAVSPRGDMFATCARDAVHVRDASTGAFLFKVDSDPLIRALSWSPDGSLLAIACYESVEVWEVSRAGAHKHKELSSAHDAPYVIRRHLAWSPDSNSIALCSTSAYLDALGLEVWRVHSGEKEHTSAQLKVVTAEWSPDGTLLATVVAGSGLQLLSTKKLDHPFDRTAMIEGSKTVRRIAFSPDSRKIAYGGDDKYLDSLTLTLTRVNDSSHPMRTTCGSLHGIRTGS